MTEISCWPPGDLSLTKIYNLKNPVLQTAGKPPFKLRDDAKEYTLRLVDYPKARLDHFEEVMRYLDSTGFANYLRVVPEVNGKMYVPGKRGSYILSEYVPGRAADLGNYDDLIICAKTLGQLHKQTKGHFPRGTDWQKHWQEALHKQKLDALSGDKVSGESKQLLPQLLAAAQKTLALLKDEEISASLRQSPSLCHCSLSGESFHITEQKQALLRDFDYSSPDVPPRDLSELLRRVLIATKGNTDLAIKALAAYFHEYPLSTGDLGVSMAFLFFPRALKGQDNMPNKYVPPEPEEAFNNLKEELVLLEAVEKLAKSLGF